MKIERSTRSRDIVPPTPEEYAEARRLNKPLTGELLAELRSKGNRSKPATVPSSPAAKSAAPSAPAPSGSNQDRKAKELEAESLRKKLLVLLD